MTQSPAKTHPHMDRILRVIDCIHAHADEDLSLDQLADVAAMSRFHWHRVFSAIMGASPAHVIRSVRMHKATMLLVRTDLPIPEVGKRVGYPNDRSFARTFKDAYGLAPQAFRKQGHEKNAPKFITGDTEMFDVSLKTAEPIRLAALSHQGDYSNISQAFQKLGPMISAAGGWPQTRGMAGVYYDDPASTPEADLRSHAGAVWAGDSVPDGMEEVTLDGGPYAVLHFKGPYSGLAAAYQYLYGPWLAEHGADLRDAPSFEIYLNDPADTAPEDLLTDIYMPLAG
ncbi:MAG: AraC family transcriptional regulator [Pseudomonadota bacterium]